MLQVKANLVSSPSDRPGFNKSESILSRHYLKVRFGVFALRIQTMSSVFFGIGAQPGLTNPLILFRLAPNDGKVAFVHSARFEQFAEAPNRTDAFAEQQNPSGFGVEAVNVFQKSQVARTRPKGPALDR